MSTDPWDEAKRDVVASLATAKDLIETLKRHQKQRATKEQVSWTRDELNATLSALEADCEELEESISVVESSGSRRFGIEDAELDRRRRFVKETHEEIAKMRRLDLTAPTKPSDVHQPYRDDPDGDLEDGDPNQDFERMQQSITQMIIEQQDHTLTSIAGVIGTLREQAGVIGSEVLDQVSMLGHLETDVDQSQSRLARANKRMKDFIEANRKSGSSWCILLLTVVLCILLFAIIWI